MSGTESRYLPVVHIILGTTSGVVLTELVNTDLGRWSYLVFTLATLGAFSLGRDVWNFVQRRRLIIRCRTAYEKVARVHKPRILNPKHPGNPEAMKEEAQRAVDDATVLMDRFGIAHPERIDVADSKSVETWYECLRPLRRDEY